MTLRQPFDYSKYPLDTQDVWLRLWHKDFDRDVVLVPDLGAYRATGMKDIFGVDSQRVTGGRDARFLDFLHRDDNLLPKLMFWPTVLLFLAAVTAITFS